jgi:hypothetical protein
MQYDKLLEQLRAEIKEKECSIHAQETRGAYDKQEVTKKVHEVQLKLDFMQEKFNMKESDLVVLKSDFDRMKEENLALKAAVKEGDKTREVLTRQMALVMRQEVKMPEQVV